MAIQHENLHMTKVCAQVVSKLLTSDQKEKRQEICADILKQIEENPRFFRQCDYCTCDER